MGKYKDCLERTLKALLDDGYHYPNDIICDINYILDDILEVETKPSRGEKRRVGRKMIGIMVGTKAKKCTRCKKVKPLLEFYKNRGLKNGYACQCKVCSSLIRKEHIKLRPWVAHYYALRGRCRAKGHVHYKDYGGRGIKSLITQGEIRGLWFRDKARQMKQPSIDRIDNDGHYELSNCRFIPLRKNTRHRSRS